MLKLVEKNKKEMITFGLFGLVGVILVPVARCIIKAANHYPKVFRWISFIIFILVCICGILFIQSENAKFVVICIGMMLVINSLSTSSRK